MNPSSVLAATCQELKEAKTVEVEEPQGRTAQSRGSDCRGTEQSDVLQSMVGWLVPERGALSMCAEGGTYQVDEVQERRLSQQAGANLNLEVV